MQTKLIFLPGDSLANPTHNLEKEKEKKIRAICGLRCLEQYERFPLVSLWAKMFAASLIGMEDWYSRRCALSWKVMGIKSRPLLYLRARLTPHIRENGFGLLPTPTASAIGENQSNHQIHISKDGVAKPIRESGVKGNSNLYATLQVRGLLVKQEIGQSSQLNPRFMAEMMGFPVNWTELPFLSGETKL